MNDKYNQPTAHMLQPVKGWDSMAHLDFVAPIAPEVDATGDEIVSLPGTVMHLDANGSLKVGLTAQGMGMYLFYKQNDEDVQPYPLTADGTQMTAVGMQSFGGYNSEVYLRHNWIDVEKNDYYNTNGTASNVGPINYNVTGNEKALTYTKGKAAHTTYPAICGMELSSTEFAAQMGNGSAIGYNCNDTLTAPAPAAFDMSKPGTKDQQLAGGFLKKGSCYIDPICGIVSKKPVINEHGYKQICFWSTWLPAMVKSTESLVAGATLAVDMDPSIFAGGPEFQFKFVDDQASGFDFDNQYAIAYTVNGGSETYVFGNATTPITASLTKDADTAFVATVSAAGASVGAVTVEGTAVVDNATVEGNKVTVNATAAQAANGKTIIIKVDGSAIVTFTFA